MKKGFVGRWFTTLSVIATIVLQTDTAIGAGLACANTYDRYFLIFDNGRIIRQDHNPAQKYWVGHNYIAFVDYMSSLRVFYQSHALELTTGITDITADDSMFVWLSAGTLRAWKGGREYLINRYVDFYKLNEGTIVFFDQNEHTLNVWYDGQTFILDENHVDFPLTSVQVSNHTVAWQTPDHQFKLFIDGDIISKSIYHENLKYLTGKHFCVVNNPFSNELMMLTKEGVYTMENSHAKWWQTRYKQLVYLSFYDDLKIVEGKLSLIIGSQNPNFKTLTNAGFFYDRSLQLYYYENNSEQMIINYIPSYYYIFERFFAYRSELGRIEIWNNGHNELPTISPVAEINLMTNVLVIQEAKKTSFWYNNKLYEYNS